MRLIIINGSHRKGNSDHVIEAFKSIANKSKIDVDELVLRDVEMKLPDGCEHCANSERCPNANDEFEREWIEKLKNYDAYLIVSPTWCDGPTPLTKIFIDRIVTFCHEDHRWLKNKKIGVITHGMSDENSLKFVTDWIESVCSWQEADFVGSYTFKSGAKPETGEFSTEDLKSFSRQFI